MRAWYRVVAIVLLLAVMSAIVGQPPATACGDATVRAIAASNRAVHGDDATRAAAITLLRNLGPEGLHALAATHDNILKSLQVAPAPATNLPAPALAVTQKAAKPAVDPVQVERLRIALEQVAQQRGAHMSLLFWHTDMEAAKAEARRSGRPILSLRLLGKLTDEYSCANSRFFRTVLYANREVADNLRDTFVLHWSTERPVPVVTVDFGDGRVLKRTMMGNSAHYVLDAQGRPVDVIPGLYGPKAFLDVVSKAAAVAQETAPLSAGDARVKLVQFHQARLEAVAAAWSADLAKTGGPNVMPGADSPNAASLADDQWRRIAALHTNDAKLDETTKALVRNERPAGPPAEDAMRLAVGKRAVETPLLVATRAALQMEQNVALDTVRNEYMLHSAIHGWFVAGDRTSDFARLNGRVYAELFLTPAGDPWMGLAPGGYTGLEGAGLAVSR